MKPIYPPNFPDIEETAETEVIFQDVIDPTKKVKRTGTCNRCGQCCTDTENVFQTVDGNNNPIPEPLVQVVPGMCAYFRWDENGLGVCTGRDTLWYKTGCRYLPTKPIHVQILDQCSYQFQWIEE